MTAISVLAVMRNVALVLSSCGRFPRGWVSLDGCPRSGAGWHDADWLGGLFPLGGADWRVAHDLLLLLGRSVLGGRTASGLRGTSDRETERERRAVKTYTTILESLKKR